MLIWTHLCTLIIKKDILILGKGTMQGLDNTALTVEAEYSATLIETGKMFCLSLHTMEATVFYLLIE